MHTTLRYASVVAALLVAASPAAAQTQLLSIEAGQRISEHHNGVTTNTAFVGFGGSAVLNGVAGKNSAVIIPFSFDIRSALGRGMDMNAFIDVAIRTGPLTIGGGMVGTWNILDEINDATLGGDDGKLPISYPYGFGWSGVARLNIGPSGKLFVQGRYTLMPGALSRTYHSAENREYYEQNGIDPQDVPQQDSNTWRASVGYTFTKVILRLQMVEEKWRFDRVYGNQTGAYDRDARLLSLGLSFIL